MFLGHNGIKLEINNRKIPGKKDIWKITTLINKPQEQKKKSQEKLENILN